MESIIKKAIEGGYEKERYYFDENGNWDWEPDEVALMKSSFWQALGKACRWGDAPEISVFYYPYAMKFYEINLTEGWDKAVKYLNSLIK